ncbi:biotin--[acetyl-CoA-carboxylase] ligase [Halovenus salina]|uniref:Biotin--[acetyl-CoA-carboxylase] ligase n=1 Tax=Halovenus salina TaxID=1510225 RepID=A0ABD5W8Y2_9EURY|nr:biotin--[acetyl-CoA-carboxylase] ligase [Halovenus salina]
MQATRAQILDALSDGPRTGPKLAEELDITRAAVWKHIEALREDGFEVVSNAAGYELEAVPDYGASAVEFGLDAPYEVEYHDSIDSTNRRGRELAGDGREDIVVLADEQTGGRGRLKREWSSPSGGIWLSLLLRPTMPTTHAPLVTMAAAVATAEAVASTGVEPEIKWPNDVLVDGKKVSGILTEMEGEADRISWLVVGIGINANVDIESLPEDRATSLRELCGDVDRREVVQTLLESMSELVADRDRILSAWRARSGTLGRRVSVETPNGEIVGEAVDVESPGALLVDTADGRERVTVGDCEHLRPE